MMSGPRRRGAKPTTADIRLDLMVESLFSGFADISLPELILIGAMAFVASVVGGVAGYGTGALMPLVLVPIVGAEPVVPILSLSALFTNSSRTAAFLPLVDWRRAAIVLVAAVPTCALDRKSTRLNSSHLGISYAVFCLKKKKNIQ